MWKLSGGKYILAGDREKKMCTMSARGGNIAHLLEECVATSREPIWVEEVASGKINMEVEEWLKDEERGWKEKQQQCRVEHKQCIKDAQ